VSQRINQKKNPFVLTTRCPKPSKRRMNLTVPNKTFVNLLGGKVSRTPKVRPNIISLTKLQGLHSARKGLGIVEKPLPREADERGPQEG